MDDDGTLTAVSTTGDPPLTYQPPSPTPSVSLPPATVAVTTTETVPPVPETITVEAPPTTGEPPDAGLPSTTTDISPPATAGPTASAPPDRPTVDVLSAEANGSGQATIQIRVSGTDPVFCHVYFNSVERAATKCAGTMTVVANDLAPATTYDIYVLGTNAVGTGVPGRRAVLRT
jgi:hypothetical protein